jgi:hypothetical protein
VPGALTQLRGRVFRLAEVPAALAHLDDGRMAGEDLTDLGDRRHRLRRIVAELLVQLIRRQRAGHAGEDAGAPLLEEGHAAGGDLHPGQAGRGRPLAVRRSPPRRDGEGAELLERGAHATGRVSADEQADADEDGDGGRDGHQGRAAGGADHAAVP